MQVTGEGQGKAAEKPGKLTAATQESDAQRRNDALDAITDFPDYLHALLHSWLRTLTMLGVTLVPAFFILDWFVIPPESRHLLPFFGMMRLLATGIVIVQYITIQRTRANRFSFLHGYFFTLVLSLVITVMTVQLGGFNAPYYAGLILVIIAVNMLLPWHGIHSIINGTMTLAMYVAANVFWGGDFDNNILMNNISFLAGTVAIAASINHVKFLLVKREFQARQDLRSARDALWGEMGIAKHIQTALLPDDPNVDGYAITAAMLPADEVGGDYYDIFEVDGCKWVLIGDVSGHGVESGLIMMMMQTTIRTLIRQSPNSLPSTILAAANEILKDNITRLGADRYVTITAVVLGESQVTFAGKHQDILVYRCETGSVEAVETTGTWIGIVDDIGHHLADATIQLGRGDVLLLFTDGVTEAQNESGRMLGQERLMAHMAALCEDDSSTIVDGIMAEVTSHQDIRDDDITVVAIRKTGGTGSTLASRIIAANQTTEAR